MKKSFGIILCLIIICAFCISFAANFKDVPNNHWAFSVINKMSSDGILSGYPDGSFKPDKSITRAEFAKIIVASLNLKSRANIHFADATDDFWAKEYIDTVGGYMNYYYSDGGVYFHPYDEAVREDVTMAIVFALNLSDKSYNSSVLNRFSDKSNISKEREKYIAIAVSEGLVKGNANGTFNPKGKLTRAEVCQLMSNAITYLGPTLSQTVRPTNTPRITPTPRPTVVPTIQPTIYATITPTKFVVGDTTPLPTATVSATSVPTAAPTAVVITTVAPSSAPTPVRASGLPTPRPTYYKTIKIPTYNNKTYTGLTQKIPDGEGYILSGITSATNAGKYVATAVLKAGYAWEDGTRDKVDVQWQIVKAKSTISISNSETSLRANSHITIKYTYDGDGDISVKSSDTSKAIVSLDKSKNSFTITGINEGNVTITLSAAQGINYKAATAEMPLLITPGLMPIYNHTCVGTLKKSYSDSSIDVKIEEIDGFYVAKIWVKDPSKQVLKADQTDADWTKNSRNVPTLMKTITSAIVACNASGFNHSPYWTGEKKHGGDWNNAPTGNLVITNGIIRRRRTQYEKVSLLAIMPDGGFRFFKDAKYDDVINSGAVSTFNFGIGATIIDGEAIDNKTTARHPRAAFGQIDNNNYVIIVTNARRNDNSKRNYMTINQVTEMGQKLGCKILFNCDGGGSATLWFNGSTYHYCQQVYSKKYLWNSYVFGSRPVADALYFSSLEKQ